MAHPSSLCRQCCVLSLSSRSIGRRFPLKHDNSTPFICSWGPQSLSFKSLLTHGTILVKLEQLLPLEPSTTRQAAESENKTRLIKVLHKLELLSHLAPPFSILWSWRWATALSRSATASSLVSPSPLCIVPLVSTTVAVICRESFVFKDLEDTGSDLGCPPLGEAQLGAYQ